MEASQVIIAVSVLYFIIAGYAILFSAFTPLTGIHVRYRQFNSTALLIEFF